MDRHAVIQEVDFAPVKLFPRHVSQGCDTISRVAWCRTNIHVEVTNMKTIQAQVNPRLLTKANRLFTGSLSGRIIEILQNARRAGATEVEITNEAGIVTVRDNGRGIGDFSRLLDLGGSAWEDTYEHSEDPAGVGLFCLAPRNVSVRSRGSMACIGGDDWTGNPVEIREDPEPIEGALLQFQDEEWTMAAVERLAVFTGMRVTVAPTFRSTSEIRKAYR